VQWSCDQRGRGKVQRTGGAVHLLEGYMGQRCGPELRSTGKVARLFGAWREVVCIDATCRLLLKGMLVTLKKPNTTCWPAACDPPTSHPFTYAASPPHPSPAGLAQQYPSTQTLPPGPASPTRCERWAARRSRARLPGPGSPATADKGEQESGMQSQKIKRQGNRKQGVVGRACLVPPLHKRPHGSGRHLNNPSLSSELPSHCHYLRLSPQSQTSLPAPPAPAQTQCAQSCGGRQSARPACCAGQHREWDKAQAGGGELCQWWA
jgi:hypothetical protein